MDLPNDQQQLPPQLLDLTQERWRLKDWRNMLLKKRKNLETPEDIQEWLQQWDKMKTKKKTLQLCQQWIRELQEQKNESIFNVPKLIDEYHCANIMLILITLNMSLRALKVCGHRYFSGYYVQNYTLMWKRLMAPELNHYLGMLIGLIGRLPALDTLRVNFQSVDGVNKSILAIVDTNIGPEHIDSLQCLRV
ncbi:hypothetical protein GGH13_001870 [Coemansia sp. S155-1]|nr:hypothetical protein GGH13_001870 [Coemansia sp. S155-1]